MAIILTQHLVRAREAFNTVFFRAIEVRLLFVDAFVFAERRLKKAQYFQGLQSPICRKCGMTSLNLNNLIGMDRYQERIWELLHDGRRAGEEEETEIRVARGEANLILHIETYQL